MKILPPEQIKSYLTAAEQRGVLPMFYLELISGLRKGRTGGAPMVRLGHRK